MKGGHIAVIDIGKTNAKVVLVDRTDLRERAVVTCPNRVIPGPPWPHADTEGLWAFVIRALAEFQASHGIGAISITTHGACAALIGKDGRLAAPVLDYEHTGPESCRAEYDALRPGFAETGSPPLAMGLNIGAQLFWQFRTDPGLKDRVRHIVTYPQYWGHRLTGRAATDVTSLGCHTDLWNPFKGAPSSLVERLGIADLLAPPRRPDETLGPVLPEIAARTGLDPGTPVLCGIHDSNASLLAHLLGQEAPFSVVSTGTWVIAMAIGAEAGTLDPGRDTLVNVNALGAPVPSARFMGGREFDMLMQGAQPEPTPAEISHVLEGGPMLMPAQLPDTGPFPGRTGAWIGAEPPVGSGERSAAVSFYLALVSAECLGLIGHQGAIHLEGPFARNACYREMLTTATGSPVHALPGTTGTSEGAALLVDMTAREASASAPAPVTLPAPELAGYAARWREGLGV